ncbi:MAG: hypothetical protein ARM1_0224 [Candidatus Micrarchaeota archaeon]|nr:MAG: hypothetical protein ARM1_0224 [Candidatus Micrarchaeota archaeon]
MHRSYVLIVLLLLIASYISYSGTVSIGFSCYTKAATNNQSIIFYNISNYGDVQASNLVINGVIGNRSYYNIEIPYINPNSSHIGDITIDTSGFYVGTYTVINYISYNQGSSRFTVAAPCIALVKNSTEGLININNISFNNNLLSLRVFNGYNSTISYTIEIIPPPEVGAEVIKSYTISPLAYSNLGIPLKLHSSANISSVIIITLDYIHSSRHFSYFYEIPYSSSSASYEGIPGLYSTYLSIILIFLSLSTILALLRVYYKRRS